MGMGLNDYEPGYEKDFGERETLKDPGERGTVYMQVFECSHSKVFEPKPEMYNRSIWDDIVAEQDEPKWADDPGTQFCGVCDATIEQEGWVPKGHLVVAVLHYLDGAEEDVTVSGRRLFVCRCCREVQYLMDENAEDWLDWTESRCGCVLLEKEYDGAVSEVPLAVAEYYVKKGYLPVDVETLKCTADGKDVGWIDVDPDEQGKLILWRKSDREAHDRELDRLYGDGLPEHTVDPDTGEMYMALPDENPFAELDNPFETDEN
jgi:hypothetical protein